MKVRTAHSNIDVEVIVKSNDKAVDELMLASRPTNNNGASSTKECYVALEPEQSASVYTWFTGSVCSARYDLYIDGAYYGSREIVATDKGEVKTHRRRRAEFRGIQASMLQPNDEIYDPRGAIVDAELIVKTLNLRIEPARLRGSGRAFGVGSIVIVVSHQLDPQDQAQHRPDGSMFPDYVHRNWQHRQDTVSDPTIPADQYMDLRHIYRGVIPQKCNKFRHDFDSYRRGSQPLATFIFYYRSKHALLSAGCMPAPDRAWVIDDGIVSLSPIKSPTTRPQTLAMTDDQPHNDGTPGPGPDLKDVHFDPGDTVQTNRGTRTFREFVMETELTRQEYWRKKGYTSSYAVTRKPQEGVRSTLLPDGRRELLLGKDSYILPPSRILKELILEEGTPLQDIAAFLLPTLGGGALQSAARVLSEHFSGIARTFEDDRGRLYIVKEEHLAKHQAQLMLRKQPRPTGKGTGSGEQTGSQVTTKRQTVPQARAKPSREALLRRRREIAQEISQLDALIDGADDDDDSL